MDEEDSGTEDSGTEDSSTPHTQKIRVLGLDAKDSAFAASADSLTSVRPRPPPASAQGGNSFFF